MERATPAFSMTLVSRPPLLARARARGLALRRALVAYAIGTYRVIAMFVLNPGLLPLALAAPLAFKRNRGRPTSKLPPLTLVSPGIWRVPEGSASEPAAGEDDGPQCVVLHYTGTGESVHAAYENTQHLFAHDARLSRATHYIFEAPLAKGAYYGPDPFSAAVWQRVEPIVSHYDGPFVLVGTSRGGMVALDHGLRVVEECGKVAAVLSLSAPLDMPRRVPVSIRTIADFTDVLTRLGEVWSELLVPVRKALTWIIADIYVMLTALVLRHHGVYDVDALTRNARDLTDHGVLDGSLRATREFRLLLRVSERELSHFRQLIARALLRHQDRFLVALLWGKNDVWIDADQCCARMLEVVNGEMRSAQRALDWCCEVHAGHGHLLSARDSAAHAVHQARVSALVDRAFETCANQRPEVDPTLSLRAHGRALREGSDD